MSKLEDAQHEAAHIVVGAALGLRLWIATLNVSSLPKSWHRWEGKTRSMTAWEPTPWPREADLLMTAAGVAWERQFDNIEKAHGDLQILRRLRVRGNARIRVLERASWAILETRATLHARVTRALLDGDLRQRDLKALFR